MSILATKKFIGILMRDREREKGERDGERQNIERARIERESERKPETERENERRMLHGKPKIKSNER